MPTLGLQGMLHGRVDPGRQNPDGFLISADNFHQPNGVDPQLSTHPAFSLEILIHRMPNLGTQSFHNETLGPTN